MAEVTPEFVLRPNNIIRMGEEPVRIEILNWASGVDFDECYRQRIVDEVDGVEVSLIGLEQLKKNKKAAGRLKDWRIWKSFRNAIIYTNVPLRRIPETFGARQGQDVSACFASQQSFA